MVISIILSATALAFGVYYILQYQTLDLLMILVSIFLLVFGVVLAIIGIMLVLRNRTPKIEKISKIKSKSKDMEENKSSLIFAVILIGALIGLGLYFLIAFPFDIINLQSILGILSIGLAGVVAILTFVFMRKPKAEKSESSSEKKSKGESKEKTVKVKTRKDKAMIQTKDGTKYIEIETSMNAQDIQPVEKGFTKIAKSGSIEYKLLENNDKKILKEKEIECDFDKLEAIIEYQDTPKSDIVYFCEEHFRNLVSGDEEGVENAYHLKALNQSGRNILKKLKLKEK